MHGFSVTTAYDGLSALHKITDDPADLVVTDYRMPQIDGKEMLRRMRERRSDLPAIIVSGYVYEIEAIDENTRVVSKPVRAEDLVSLAKTMLYHDD
jgi:CheY-like chemotaxis protein